MATSSYMMSVMFWLIVCHWWHLQTVSHLENGSVICLALTYHWTTPAIFTMLHKLMLSNNSSIKQILLDRTVGIRWSVLTCISGLVERNSTKSPPQYLLYKSEEAFLNMLKMELSAFAKEIHSNILYVCFKVNNLGVAFIKLLPNTDLGKRARAFIIELILQENSLLWEDPL